MKKSVKNLLIGAVALVSIVCVFFLGQVIGGLFQKPQPELPADYTKAFNMTDGTINSLTDYGKTLQKLEIPQTINEVEVQSIAPGAFINATFTEVTLPNSVIEIGEQAFRNCKNLKKIVLPENILTIPSRAFSGCSALESVENGLIIESLGIGAFYNCSSLKTFYLPEGMTIINDSVFYGCSSLNNIEIPYTIEEVCAEAFSGCTSLTSLNFSERLLYIEIKAFYNCSSLTSITLGKYLKSIGSFAFFQCTALSTINYDGQIYEWNNIEKGSYWNKECSFTITCSNGITPA